MALPAAILALNTRPPLQRTITIIQGATFYLPWTLSQDSVAIPLTGATATLLITPSIDDSTVIISKTTNPLLSDGVIPIRLTPAETLAIPFNSAGESVVPLGRYQITLTDGTDTVLLAHGLAQIVPSLA